MTPTRPPPLANPALAAYFWSGERLCSRSVSGVIPHAVLDIPAPPARLVADWQRDAKDLGLEAGDVEALQLVRTRARWNDYPQCVQAMAEWMRGQTLADGLNDAQVLGDLALMVCRGARYHNDAAHYGGAAFCNLFLSDDKGLDLHFAATGLRLPLQRGLAVVFDTGQPHAVVRRGAVSFDAADFATDVDCAQFFLTWELPIENTQVARALGVQFDLEPAAALESAQAHLRLNGQQVTVNPATGSWQHAS